MFGGKERTKREEECIVAGIRFISWEGGGNEGKGGSNHDEGYARNARDGRKLESFRPPISLMRNSAHCSMSFGQRKVKKQLGIGIPPFSRPTATLELNLPEPLRLSNSSINSNK